MSQKKRKQLNIEEKTRIISKLERGILNKDLAKEYGVPHSTISSIWKERERIKTLFDKNFLKMKRARTSRHKEIEAALLKWIELQRSNNVPINGPILQQKANDFARSFGEDFVCSSSWVQRFRTRHGITTGSKVCQNDNSAVDEWISRKWPILCEGYGPNDIFNADETGLFYDMTPDRSLKYNRGNNCSEENMAETRLTILVASNMTGTIKRKLLVVGKSKNPRCFKNVHSLPVTYASHEKSLMTSEIFERWIRNWDDELKINNRKILLLVDTCPTHQEVTNLKYIKLVFIPQNGSSVLQPMDQGIISSLKYHYRKMQVLNIIQSFVYDEPKNLTILDAIVMISEAWGKVTQNTIANCFKHAGFKDLSLSSHDDDMPLVEQLLSITDNEEEDNMSLVQLAKKLRPALSAIEVEQFINVDSSIAICSPTMKDDNIQEMDEKNERKDEVIEEELIVTVKTEENDEEMEEQYIDEVNSEENNDKICDSVQDIEEKNERNDEVIEEESMVPVKTEDYDEKIKEQFIVPTLNEGLNAVNVLRKILLFKEQFHIKGNYDDTLSKLQCELQKSYFQMFQKE